MQEAGTADTFSAEERAAMNQRSKELRTRKPKQTPEEDRAEVLAAIAALEGPMWPSGFAIVDVTPEVEQRIADLVRRAVK